MKILFFILAFSVLFTACSSDSKTNTTEATQHEVIKLGEAFTIANTKTVDEVAAILKDPNTAWELVQIDGANNVDGVPAQIKGKVSEVCKTSGCWLSFTTSDNKEFLVTIRDKAFKLPADLENKEVIVNGGAYNIITSVEELRHEAKSKGWSQERIMQINEPIVEYYFSCTGIEIL